MMKKLCLKYNISDDNKNQKNNDFSNKERISEKEENQGPRFQLRDDALKNSSNN